MENVRNNKMCNAVKTMEKQKTVSAQQIPEWKKTMLRAFLRSHYEKNK